MENKQIDLSTMSVGELKALAYDLVVLLNQTQANLNIVETTLKSKLEQTSAQPQE